PQSPALAADADSAQARERGNRPGSAERQGRPHSLAPSPGGDGGTPATAVPSPERPSTPATVVNGSGGWGIREPGAFAALTAIGVLDAAARGASLTFIPFLLQAKGLDAASMGFYFAVLFGAGAAGKFVCGPLGDRYGSVATIAVTELVTAGALLGLLGAPAGWVLAALLPLGFVLNGTSSVLYAAVAGLVETRRRARGYGLYYTCSQMASALAPVLYGLLADRAGLPTTFVAMAAVTALIVPLTLVAGRGLR
ncbi:MAG: MFS transporter, partial [Chloroflexota bacterium]